MAITIDDDVCVDLIDLHMKTMDMAKKAGETWPDSVRGRQEFLAMGLGEAGEVQNLYKKMMRGDKISPEDVNFEIIDTLSYVLLLCYERGCDPSITLRRKLKIYRERLAEREKEEAHGPKAA